MENQHTFPPLTASCLAHGWKEIGAAFGVSSVPCVSIGELWEWLKGRERNQPSPLPVKVSPQGTERRETGKDEAGEGQDGKINLEDCECPYCASVGTLRQNGEKYRCEWCRQSFTRDELGES